MLAGDSFGATLEYFADKYGKVALPVEPHYTSQECPDCGVMVNKSLSTRTHTCKCGCLLQRDHAAAINILRKGKDKIATSGHGGSCLLNGSQETRLGVETSIQSGETALQEGLLT